MGGGVVLSEKSHKIVLEIRQRGRGIGLADMAATLSRHGGYHLPA
jgi:hypothetical protein